MSNFTVPIVRIKEIQKHPNADTLSTTVVEGEPVVFKTGDFQTGDLAIYVPLDAVVPEIKGTEFLGKHRRIKAVRLRGIYSEGLLLPISVLPKGNYKEGECVANILGIKKYEDQAPESWGTSGSSKKLSMRGDSNQEKNPGVIPHYDIESYKKYSHLLTEGEKVVVTEKIHGCNSRYGWVNGKFFVGSHNCFWRNPEREPSIWWKLFRTWRSLIRKPVPEKPFKPNLFWNIAKQYRLAEKLKNYPNYIFYGEIYGQVQDLTYGAGPQQVWFRVFDIYDVVNKYWLDWGMVEIICEELKLGTVPVLYVGPFYESILAEHVEGQSVLAKNIREGVVVKPYINRSHARFGRIILKWVSQGYKLRKGKTTELH